MVEGPTGTSPAMRMLSASAQSRFGLLFLVLLLTLLVPPLLPKRGGLPGLVLVVGLTLAVLSGLWAVAGTRRQGMLGVALLAAAIVLTWLEQAVVSDALDIAATAVSAVFVGYLAFATLAYVLHAKRVDANVIFAALCVYLLIGFLCGGLYYLIELVASDPRGLTGNLWMDDARSECLYFSFVTLTTLGYGDISPMAHPARSLAIVQALIGQLYLVTLIARLVALHIMHQHEEAGR
ncbi:MAG: ion channel [Planctomycetota bacterium]|nr:ion channel [Planctomycetota bacterium]